MQKIDVVYILRNDIKGNTAELKYSIRSVVKNWPYRNIVFVGGDPGDIVPDVSIYHEQTGATAYERVRDSLLRVADDDRITKNYWLFNDDFFIMRPIDSWVQPSHGAIAEHAERLGREVKGGQYEKEIRYSGEVLKGYGLSTVNYSLHVPFKINREKSKATLQMFTSSAMFKNLYGNCNKVKHEEWAEDSKIRTIHTRPTGKEAILSTNEFSFRSGFVGMYIRQRFPEPTKYERG